LGKKKKGEIMKLTKKEKDYLLFNLRDGDLDDRKKDLRRWSNRNIEIEKEIKSEIKILISITNKIEKEK
jgi:hypothetical protein